MPVARVNGSWARAGRLAAIVCGLLLSVGCASLAPAPTPTLTPRPSPTTAPSPTPADPVAAVQDAAQFEQLKAQGKPTVLAVLDRTRT